MIIKDEPPHDAAAGGAPAAARAWLARMWAPAAVVVWLALVGMAYCGVTQYLWHRTAQMNALARLVERAQTTTFFLEYTLHVNGYRDIQELRAAQRPANTRPLFAAVDRSTVYALIMDLRGVIVVHMNDPAQEGTHMDVPAFAQAGTNWTPQLGELRMLLGGTPRHVIDICMPLRMGGVVQGIMRVGYLAPPLTQPGTRRQMLAGVVAMGVAALGCGLVAFWHVRRQARVYQQALQQQRVAVERELALVGAGIVHEVKNALNGMRMNADLLQEAVAPLPDAQREKAGKKIARIQHEAARTGELLGEFLSYTKPPAFAPAPMNLVALLDECAQYFEPQCRTRGVTLQCQCAPALAALTADAGLLRQAVTNLAWNALQVVPDHGAIRMHAALQDADVCIGVADTGGGMTPDVARQAFTAFFSTKPHGAGLGLAIVQRVARSHGGDVSLDNRPGDGCTFTIRFPFHGV
jgi:signal transduction histidine kinase